MKFPLVLLVILAASGFGPDARAADWWYVAWDKKGEGDAIAYVDKSRIERISRGSKVLAWGWTVFREDQTGEFGNYRSEKDRWVLDCETMKAGIERSQLYSAYGGLVHETRQAEPGMEAVAPDSLRAIVAVFICSEGRQPSAAIPVYDPSKDAEQRFWLRGRQTKP